MTSDCCIDHTMIDDRLTILVMINSFSYLNDNSLIKSCRRMTDEGEYSNGNSHEMFGAKTSARLWIEVKVLSLTLVPRRPDDMTMWRSYHQHHYFVLLTVVAVQFPLLNPCIRGHEVAIILSKSYPSDGDRATNCQFFTLRPSHCMRQHMYQGICMTKLIHRSLE